MTIGRATPWALTLSWSLLTAILVAVSLMLTDGRLIYTLDDPYIHLAVAESTLQGGYGVNGGEYSSPSSSIAYPLLLALTQLIGLGAWGPLVLNLLAMGLAVHALGVLLVRHVVPRTGLSPLATLIAGLALALCMNSWGLPMTGMEHSLHVLTVVLLILGFAEMQSTKATPWWLVPAIVAMPLVRFEGLALSLAAVGSLYVLGRRRAAIAAGSAILAAQGAWMLVMHALSLPLLPSSVMVKSGVSANAVGGSVLRTLLSIADNTYVSMRHRQGVLLLLALAALVVGSVSAHRRGERELAIGVGATCSIALLAHVAFGQYGWFARYEVYIVTATVLALLLLCCRMVESRIARLASLWALAVLAAPYAYATVVTPLASRGIYAQHYQMHRFVTEFWKGPVAVNDIGYVSYQNPRFVLDLWGLGSEEVRQLKQQNDGLSPEVMAALVARHHVSLVMIYEEWFRALPAQWRRVAVLKSGVVTGGSGRLSFFAAGDEDGIRESLQRFASTLPSGVELEIKPKELSASARVP